MFMRKQRTKARDAAPNGRRKRLKLHEFSGENDIRYRGPLSYRALLILGWLAIALTPLPFFLNMLITRDPSVGAQLGGWREGVRVFSALSLPLLLIANFARILNNDDEYRSQMLLSGSGVLGFTALFCLLVYRYVLGGMDALAGEGAGAAMARAALEDNNGFICFNVFVDLFLCQLFMFFMNYIPKRGFTGRKLILFRLFALLPVGYEAASIALKILATEGTVRLPLFVCPLLTVKPPMTFLVFVALVLFVKRREIRFCRKGGRTREEYRAFLKTNRNSLHFSVFLTVILLVGGILDLVVMTLITTFSAVGAADPELEAVLMASALDTGLAAGIGGGVVLIPLAPFMLLFSYTRRHRSRIVDALIPVAAIVLSILICLEGAYQGLRRRTPGILGKGALGAYLEQSDDSSEEALPDELFALPDDMDGF